FNQITGGVSFGGPLRIPHLIPLRSAPNFFIAYQIVRNRNGSTQSALVPTADQRTGLFAQPVLDPTTGMAFAGNTIPMSRLSPQALSLLRFYPLPNASGPYNYQVPIVGRTDTDSLQGRLSKGIGRSNQVYGNFAYQNARNLNNNIFNFPDRTGTLGYQVTANWLHRFSNRIFTTTTVTFSRQTLDTNPYFANRENVSAEAGIAGNDQTPVNWGPPSLNFGASNIYGLSDTTDNHVHNQQIAIGSQTYWARSPHNFTFGGDFKRNQSNVLGQSNPRGAFTFNGQATGYDFADFLLGVPDASSIAYGNADKYFRSSIYDLYINDDWRVTPSLTVNAGVRWDYWTPISEKYGRLVNLDIANGFSAAAPVIGNSPTGSLTGTKYPSSLIEPDRHAFSPKIGVAWRPIAGSSLVIRAGYGVSYDTSVYQTIASRMAQQAPLSKSFSVQNTPAAPLTLANGFIPSSATTPTTFAIDPNFRIGYAQSWQLSVQRDLPGSLVLNATYLGIKGTRGVQQFLPNTYPPGFTSPCVTCLPGYVYMASNGNSTNQKGTVQLRRRLHNGFTATVAYTYAKAIDDAALGGGGQAGAVIAQNWLDLSAERGLSPFDQRHQVSFSGQYTTGVGAHGGTLLDGWRGTAFKEWTISTTITAGTGYPLTPIYSAITPGTGISSSIRPDYTGASLYNAPPGLFLNPLAFAAPPSGQWGTAGRNSIEGPDIFTIGASAARTFRLPEKFSRANLDVIANSQNPINHPTFQNWVTNIQSPQFGLPGAPNGMRTLQLIMRVRF
ncbi:MAG: TonB-dependent receptor, partial [Acidobacteriota bacterium]|nr:TonB-dependent receptor [Acidobacteriota bacterium]